MPADKLFAQLQSKYPDAEVTSVKVVVKSRSGREIGSTNKISVKPRYARIATHCYYAD